MKNTARFMIQAVTTSIRPRSLGLAVALGASIFLSNDVAGSGSAAPGRAAVAAHDANAAAGVARRGTPVFEGTLEDRCSPERRSRLQAFGGSGAVAAKSNGECLTDY